ncbi:MAG: hypothetical protein DFNUSKGM_000420 [Candidatus Fervidibacter sacchari]
MKFRSLQEWKEAVLKEKERLRRELAKLPYEEKVARLKRIQQVAREVAKVREQLRRQIDNRRQRSE